ncbi:hypothetical protein F4806DRAFT_114927 [Annulohypoxylon nitens]|nr:hypothetical protein F4806DRAFT_114927 [Annulohypoxylon nitens]
MLLQLAMLKCYRGERFLALSYAGASWLCLSPSLLGIVKACSCCLGDQGCPHPSYLDIFTSWQRISTNEVVTIQSFKM